MQEGMPRKGAEIEYIEVPDNKRNMNKSKLIAIIFFLALIAGACKPKDEDSGPRMKELADQFFLLEDTVWINDAVFISPSRRYRRRCRHAACKLQSIAVSVHCYRVCNATQCRRANRKGRLFLQFILLWRNFHRQGNYRQKFLRNRPKTKFGKTKMPFSMRKRA